MTTRSWRHRAAMTLMFGLLMPGSVVAQEVGKINVLEPHAEGISGGQAVPARDNDAVNVGSELRTLDPGRASVFLYDERVPIRGRVQRLGPDTQLRVESVSGTVLSVTIKRGWLNAVGPTLARSGNAGATAPGTEFVMSYDPDTVVTEVISVVGEVEVRNLRGGPTVTLHEREITRVVGRRAPEQPRTIDDAELLRYIRRFEFIGGGKEQSQATNNAILVANEVPPPDRLPPLVPPAVDDDPRRAHLVEVFPQPPAVIEAIDLGIDF